MFQLFVKTKPVSQNNRRRKIPDYQFRLNTALQGKYGIPLIPFGVDQSLYGIVYLFANYPTRMDSDNLSKPLWDALQGILYQDDVNIRLRVAGIITRDEYDNYPIDPDWDAQFILEIENFFGSEDKEMIFIQIDDIDVNYYKFQMG